MSAPEPDQVSATPSPPARHPMPPPNPMSAIEVDAQGRRLCGAKTRSGGTCAQPSMAGQRRCRLHGGASPQAKRKAALRLAELVDPAVATLARVMATGAKDSDKLRAAEAILDRAGHPRASRVERTYSPEEARELLLERLRALRDRGQRDEMIEDAEVVEDREGGDDARALLAERLRELRTSPPPEPVDPSVDPDPDEPVAESEPVETSTVEDEPEVVEPEPAAPPRQRGMPSGAELAIRRAPAIGTPGGAILAGANDSGRGQ